MEAQAAAIKAPARLPAIEGETYNPPDHSVTVHPLTLHCQLKNSQEDSRELDVPKGYYEPVGYLIQKTS